MFPKSSSGLLDHYRWTFAMVQRLLDGVIAFTSLFPLCWYFGVPFDRLYFDLGFIAFLLTLAVFQWYRLYRPWRGANVLYMAQRTVLAWIMVVVLLSSLGFLTKTASQFSRKIVITWIMFTPVALVAIRLVVYQWLRWLRSRGLNIRTVVIGGAGNLGVEVAKNIREPWLGMRLLGFFDDLKKGKKVKVLASHGRDYPILGDLDKMAEFVNNRGVDMVYLALPMRAEERLREVIESLKDTTASLYLVPDVFAFTLIQASMSDLRGIPIISIWETPFIGLNGLLKRIVDFILAVFFILGTLPVLVFCAIGVKLSSPGPIIFKQRRYGLDGKEIVVYKFRTMTVCLDGHNVPLSVRNDSRVTRFGAFLRRHSLDELPQFFNVLVGTMSVVGPRPHAVAHNEFYRSQIPGYMLRHKVRPGLTGWAQINGYRGEAGNIEMMKKRVEFDLDYLCHWSFWLDLKIIFRSVVLVFKDNKAL